MFIFVTSTFPNFISAPPPNSKETYLSSFSFLSVSIFTCAKELAINNINIVKVNRVFLILNMIDLVQDNYDTLYEER